MVDYLVWNVPKKICLKDLVASHNISIIIIVISWRFYIFINSNDHNVISILQKNNDKDLKQMLPIKEQLGEQQTLLVNYQLG